MGIGKKQRCSRTMGIIAGILVLMTGSSSRGDAFYDWPVLSGVKTIGFVNPFFRPVDARVEKGNEAGRGYVTDLQLLRLTLQKSMLERLRQQTRFVLVPQARVEQEFHKLHWTAEDLFEKRGSIRGKSWPVPNRRRIAQLAQRIGADALLVGELHPPASIPDGAQLRHEIWNANPLNISLRRMRAHVISPRAQIFMITREGDTVWKDEQMADRPRTNPRTPHTLLLDWQEATAQVASQVADSVLRLQPPNR